MLNRSGNTTDNLCFRYRFRDVFSRFRCCVYNGTGPLFVHVKHNGNMELHVSATFKKYGNMWFRPVRAFCLKWKKGSIASVTFVSLQTRKFYLQTLFSSANWVIVCKTKRFSRKLCNFQGSIFCLIFQD